jgi:hypothetical protein
MNASKDSAGTPSASFVLSQSMARVHILCRRATLTASSNVSMAEAVCSDPGQPSARQAPSSSGSAGPSPLQLLAERDHPRVIFVLPARQQRRTCGSLLAALDVHPRVAMGILRHSRIGLTMDIYTQVPDKTTKEALTQAPK